MRVLIVKIAAIGDFLMATPAIRALKEDPRVTEVQVVTGSSIRSIVEGNPHIDRIHWIDDRVIFQGNLLRKAGEVLRISRLLRRERIDVGFNFHRDWRYNLILFLAGIKRRIGFAGPKRGFLLSDAVQIKGIKHHIFHYCDLLKSLDIFCLDFKMVFRLSPQIQQGAEEKFLKSLAGSGFVVLAPGGAVNVKEKMESRRWGTANFSELAGLLLAEGRRVVLVGSIDDSAISQAIRLENSSCLDLTGQTSLAEAAAILKKARLMITNDSGLMHLAEAVGTPIISLFGPTHPDEKKPLSEGCLAVWKGRELECSPCYHDGRFPECRHLECLARIKPAEIVSLARRMLGP